uniref:Succinate dehydrogenase cytochrome B560 subunit n=1 Tax=Cyanidiococcus yangmingshanensis TaxID=2690220 RepID=A0A7H0WBF5_9RHOD|nr:succinate dehydrogenase cytochrome B560 subunit [Cyanidiococcus yangmingshanensis]UNJ18960.1 succinate:cytochrome c oxidoreductase subunit 3 [Cyanidioschyzonaceae sp. 2 FvB-2021]
MVNYINRPISPHITVYNVEWNSIYSIFHRISAIVMVLVFFVFVFVVFFLKFYLSNILTIWFLLVFNRPFFLVFLSLGFFYGLLFLYHLCSGIYHLFLESGYFFQIEKISMISKWSLIFSIIITFSYFLLIIC